MHYYNEPYEKLIVWQKLKELRGMIFVITNKFNKPGNYRLVEQMRSAARSAKQNFCEGYKKQTVKQFLNFCNISRASLVELKEDIKDCYEDKLISDKEHRYLMELIIKTSYLLDKYIKAIRDLKIVKWSKQ